MELAGDIELRYKVTHRGAGFKRNKVHLFDYCLVHILTKCKWFHPLAITTLLYYLPKTSPPFLTALERLVGGRRTTSPISTHHLVVHNKEFSGTLMCYLDGYKI